MEKGFGLVKLGIVIIILIVLGIFAYNFIQNWTKSQKIEDIEANMLLIQGQCKVIEEGSKVNNVEDESLIGQKVSENAEDSIIAEFLTKNILDTENLDKYYFLTDEDLVSLGLDITNEENSYYIINYEDNTVYITCGYENGEEIAYTLEE